MVTIVARYLAKAGAGDAVEAALAMHVVATRGEPGCLQFDACRGTDNPEEFVLYEKYIDDGAFEAHRRSPHFAAYVLGRIVPMLERREWQRYEDVGPETHRGTPT